jgi:UDP-GlcNAc:undecaprenyl-phosphate GlcNAc-1-phosphate transferase
VYVDLGIVTFLVATIAAWVSTSILIVIAPRIGAMDLPGPRKVHSGPIPRIGGVAVFIGFAAGLIFAAQASGRLFAFNTVTVHWRVLALAAFSMFLMGLVDDLRGLSFKSKFAVQIAAAVAVWSGGFRIEILSNPFGGDPIEFGLLSLPVTVLWIVGITNAINLIDGLDGLAAGVALIMTVAMAAMALFQGHLGVVATSVALVGALLGFLFFNFNPAKIFLGDSGSNFLGFVLAVISIRGAQKATTAVAVLAPLLILGLPILDTSLAVLRRLIRISSEGTRNGNGVAHVVSNVHRVFHPDRGHLHHRLLDLGLSHRSSVLVLYGFVVLLALAALGLVFKNSLIMAAVLLGLLSFLTASFVLWIIVRRRRRAALESATSAGPSRNVTDASSMARS